MATPRRMKNSPSRSTMLPRRNPQRPGMGGANTPRTRGNTAGLWGGNQDPQNVSQALAGLGFNPGQAGFGFDAGQQSSLMDELTRIAHFSGGEGAAPAYDWNPQRGIAGNLMSYERQLGMDPSRIDPLGASGQQRQDFANAFGFQGQLPPMQGHMQHPQQGGQQPQQPPWGTHGNWDAGHGGWQGPGQGGPGPAAQGQGGQYGPMLQGQPVPQQQPPPQYYSPGHMGGPVQVPPEPPQYYSPGYRNPNIPQYQPPQSFSPGNPHQGMPPQPPQMQGYAQQGPMGYPQSGMAGVMPPFAGASPGAGSGPQQPGYDPNPATYDQFQQLGFNQLQLPGWQSMVQGYYNEMPQQPSYLTGQGLTQQQAYMSQLQNQLAGLQGQYGQVAPEYNLAGLRLQNDYGQAHDALAESLAGRGIYDSGIATSDFRQQQGDYNRQVQDLQQQGQSQVGGLYSQAGQAFDQTQQALLNLYAQQALQQAQDPYAPYKQPTPKRKKK